MPIKTADQYLDSLKDGRSIYIDGEQIKDVTKDKRTARAAQTMANLLQMQHDPKLADTMTYDSPTTGDKVGITHKQPKSQQDIVERNDAIKVWMDDTCGMLGRSPDYKNVMWSAYSAAADIFDRDSYKGAQKVRDYQEYVRENDMVMTHVLAHPQVDRSKPAHLQTSELVAHIVKETDAGIVINGCRTVATLCALANEIVVMPAAVRWSTEEKIDTTDYSFGFSIPAETEGLKFICRPSFANLDSDSVVDYPFSLRYDETDGFAVFDNVLVPWDRVFIHRDPDFDGIVTGAAQIYPHMVMQSVVRAVAKSEFMMALTYAIARTTKIDVHNPVQLLLAETMSIAEFARTCRTAAEAGAHENEYGLFVPANGPLQLWQSMYWKLYTRQCEILKTLGAGGLVSAPSIAELSGDMKDNIETYFQAANADSETRIRILRLAYDAALSSFAGRQQLYEQYYLGDPARAQSMWYRNSPIDEPIQRIHDMLTDLAEQDKK